MAFSFDSEYDKMTHMSVKSIINNDGAFKSKGQYYAMFVKGNGRTDAELVFENYGVRCDEGHKVLTAHASNTWAHGAAAIIPMLWMAVIDCHGVVAQYKIKGNGNLRDGWKPNPAKTELLYLRSTTPVRSEWLIAEDNKLEFDPYIDEDAMVMRKLTDSIEYGVRAVRTGKVISVKEVYENYGYGTRTVIKMLVLIKDGSKMYGTVPASIVDLTKRDTEVTFTAALKYIGESDFCIFTRPSKASVQQMVDA